MASIIQSVSPGSISLVGASLPNDKWRLYTGSFDIQDGTLDFFSQDTSHNTETVQSISFETLDGGYSLSGVVLEGEVTNRFQGIDGGELVFGGLTQGTSQRAQKYYYSGLSSGTLLFNGKTLNNVLRKQQAYYSGLTACELELLGLTPFDGYTGKDGRKSAALKLGLYSKVDVWSTPLQKYQKKFTKYRPTEDIDVDINAELAQIQLLQLQIQELQQSLGRINSQIQVSQHRNEIREAKKRLKRLKYEYLMAEDEELLLLLI